MTVGEPCPAVVCSAAMAAVLATLGRDRGPGSPAGPASTTDATPAGGQWLAGQAVTALIDLSDGLATDARRLADASGRGPDPATGCPDPSGCPR